VANNRDRYSIIAGAYSDSWWSVQIVDDNGDPVDLTGTEQIALIKNSDKDSDKDAVGEFEIDVSDATNGTLLLHLPKNTVSPGQYYSSVLVKWPEGHSLWPGAEVNVLLLDLTVERETTRGEL